MSSLFASLLGFALGSIMVSALGAWVELRRIREILERTK